MKDKNMIYTVTLNPAVDCTLKASDYSEGKVNRAESETLSAGGKGINMSVILHRLGADTTALGFIGGDTGKLFCSLLDKLECPHDMTGLDGQLTRINVKLNAEGTETEINGKGPYISPQQLESFITELENRLSDGDSLILAGSVPESVPPTIYSDIVKRLNSRNVRIIADSSGKLLTELVKMKPFLIKPNNHELAEICGFKVVTHEDAFRGAEILQKMGAENVLVSLAGDGAVFLSEKGERYEVAAPHGTVVNSVGAGDSMVAGFLAGYEKYGSFKEALLLGTAAGSATAFSESLADADEIQKLYNTLAKTVKFS